MQIITCIAILIVFLIFVIWMMKMDIENRKEEIENNLKRELQRNNTPLHEWDAPIPSYKRIF